MKPEPLVIIILLGLAISVLFAIGFGIHKLLFTRTRKPKTPPSLTD